MNSTDSKQHLLKPDWEERITPVETKEHKSPNQVNKIDSFDLIVVSESDESESSKLNQK